MALKDYFDKIRVFYWHLSKLGDLPWEHLEEFEYDTRKRNQIIDKVLDKGYSVMLKQSGETGTLIIYIDKYRFGQR